MSSTPPPQRFVPTLTEVVNLPPQLQSAPSASHGIATGLNVATLAEDIARKLRPLLEQELQHSAQTLLQAHMASVMPALQQRVEEAVRQALPQVLGDNTPRMK